MMRKAIKVNLSDDVISQISEMIESGVYTPGTRLPPEREMAEELGISRNTLREALKALMIMGVLETKQGGGNYVSTGINEKVFASSMRFFSFNSYKEVCDLLATRRLLETENARLAAKAATPELVRELWELHQLIRDNSEDTNIASLYDTQLHYKIAEASQNTFLCELTRTLSIPMHSLMFKTTYVADLMSFTNDYHEKMLHAIENHNSEDAAKFMYEHLVKIENMIRENGLEGFAE